MSYSAPCIGTVGGSLLSSSDNGLTVLVGTWFWAIVLGNALNRTQREARADGMTCHVTVFSIGNLFMMFFALVSVLPIYSLIRASEGLHHNHRTWLVERT